MRIKTILSCHQVVQKSRKIAVLSTDKESCTFILNRDNYIKVANTVSRN